MPQRSQRTANAAALSVLFLLIGCGQLLAAGKVLIVADEMPQMEVLAEIMKSRAGSTVSLVKPTEMPAQLGSYSAVVVFIHQALEERVEKVLIEYGNSGGRLVLFHHSINSQRRKNKDWLPFLGIELPLGDLDHGGYYYALTPTAEVVNLAPDNYLTTHKVKYDTTIQYKRSDTNSEAKPYPGFLLTKTEIYLNHKFTDSEKKVLLGLRYQDPKSGRLYMQDRAGWYKKTGKGWVVYFMFGHSVEDFEHPAFSQIALNAVSGPLR
jgi:hypothetical protein